MTRRLHSSIVEATKSKACDSCCAAAGGAVLTIIGNMILPGIGGFVGGVISGELTGWACPKICSAIGF
jgi:hypothetical protein